TRAERAFFASEGTAVGAAATTAVDGFIGLLCRYLLERECRDTSPIARVFDCDAADVALSINIQERVFVEVSGLGDFSRSKLDIQRISVLEIFYFHRSTQDEILPGDGPSFTASLRDRCHMHHDLNHVACERQNWDQLDPANDSADNPRRASVFCERGNRCGSGHSGDGFIGLLCAPGLLEIFWAQSRFLGDLCEHFRTNLLAVVKREHVVRPAWSLQELM